MAETGKRSSTFEVVTAMIVKCRARAVDLTPEAEFPQAYDICYTVCYPLWMGIMVIACT